MYRCSDARVLEYLIIGRPEECVNIRVIIGVTVPDCQNWNYGLFNKFLHCIDFKVLE